MQNGHNLNTGSLTFANNYAANDAMTGMPLRDFTVEFWARTPAIVEGTPPPSSAAEFCSFATRLQSQSEPSSCTNPAPCFLTSHLFCSEPL